MSIIEWVGESDHWEPPESAGSPWFIMPLTERCVLKVAMMTAPAPTRKLTLEAGLNCTSRLALRVALASTSLNPKWVPFEWNGPSVAKAPASSANIGIRYLHHSEYIEYLQEAAPDLARFGVLEEYIDGPQFEVDGYVIGRKISWFHPLFQVWNDAGDEIVSYERKEPPSGWLEAMLAAIRAVGINDAPFCVEMRHDRTSGQWKIIEIHARLGEDRNLAEFMCDEPPLAVIERACLSSIDGARWPTLDSRHPSNRK